MNHYLCFTATTATRPTLPILPEHSTRLGETSSKLINYTQESGGKRHFILEVHMPPVVFFRKIAYRNRVESGGLSFWPGDYGDYGGLMLKLNLFLIESSWVWAQFVDQSMQHNCRSLNGATSFHSKLGYALDLSRSFGLSVALCEVDFENCIITIIFS